MPEFVSVLQGEGSDVVVTVSAAHAKRRRLDPLDQPAVDVHGVPLKPRRRNGRPVKPRTSVDAEAEKKKSKSTTGDEPATSA